MAPHGEFSRKNWSKDNCRHGSHAHRCPRSQADDRPLQALNKQDCRDSRHAWRRSTGSHGRTCAPCRKCRPRAPARDYISSSQARGKTVCSSMPSSSHRFPEVEVLAWSPVSQLSQVHHFACIVRLYSYLFVEIQSLFGNLFSVSFTRALLYF